MHKASVLIVDDDPGAIQSFGPMLSSHGFEARAALDAAMALQEIERSIPDVILLDLHLPIIDGLELLRRLRSAQRFATIPVALVTGNYLLDDHVVEELGRLGSLLHYKPLWEDDILQIVLNLLQLSNIQSTVVERNAYECAGVGADRR